MTKMGGDALRYIGCMSLLLSIEATFFITNNETREYALQFFVLFSLHIYELIVKYIVLLF